MIPKRWMHLTLSCVVLLFVFVSEIRSQNNLAWWQTSIIYQVYPRSFQDSNGDGVGDLKGIQDRLDHFKYIGVDSFWLSPVYQSPMRDFGYDISNFTNIDPIFGTIQDFKNLIDAAHAKGLNLIMDFVPGHTSSDHPWFNKSVHREGNYTDYYVWVNGTKLDNGTTVPPNNWLSVFNFGVWTWNDIRQQYYYHAFLPSQPDLNYRNPNVHEEMKNVLRFWLDLGVDGFRVDAIEKLYEVENVSLNEPLSGLNVSSDQYDYLSHIYTSNQPETIDTVTEWYNVCKEYEKNKPKYMIIELYADPKVRNELYKTGGNPFNFDLIDLTSNVTGTQIRDLVKREYDNLPKGTWPNFVLGNHDRRRVSYKFGALYVDVYNMLLLTLWGTPTTYYGEEIGMLEALVNFNQTVDPYGQNMGPDLYQLYSRDYERSPMQWSSGYQAGFTTGNTTWLPLGQNYTTVNVETEKNSTKLTSIQLYSKLAQLRQRPVFQTGNFTVAVADTNIFSFVREDKTEKYLVAINVGKATATNDFSAFSANATSRVVAFTPGMKDTTDNTVLRLNQVTLAPGDGLVLELQIIKKNNSGPAVKAGVLSLFVALILSLCLCLVYGA